MMMKNKAETVNWKGLAMLEIVGLLWQRENMCHLLIRMILYLQNIFENF